MNVLVQAFGTEEILICPMRWYFVADDVEPVDIVPNLFLRETLRDGIV